MNYKNILITLVLSMLSGLLSCNESQTLDLTDDGIVPVDTIMCKTKIDTIPSGVICGLKWIPLSGSGNGLFREISKLIVRDSMFVVVDRSIHKVVAFNNPGDFLYQIANRGQGPEEYLEIAAASASDSILYLMDNYSHHLQQYALADGRYIGTINVPFIAWDVEIFSDNDFLFTCLNNNPDSEIVPKPMDYAVWRTDSTMAVTHTYLPLPENYCEMIGKRRYFTKDIEGNINFHCYRYPGFFTFTQDPAQEPVFHYVIFDHTIPFGLNLRYKDIRKRKYNYLSGTPFVHGKDWIGIIGCGEDTEPMLWHNASHKVYKNSYKWGRNLIIYDIVGVNDEGFIGYLNDGYRQYQDAIEHGFPRADSITEKHIKQDDCVLVIYRFCSDE